MSKPPSLDAILRAHQRALSYGGVSGIRDGGALIAAVSSPWLSMMGHYLYPSDLEKGCRLAFEVITQHPFIDGNKRTAFILMMSLFDKNGVKIYHTREEIHQMFLRIAAGQAKYDDLVQFMSSRPVQRRSSLRR